MISPRDRQEHSAGNAAAEPSQLPSQPPSQLPRRPVKHLPLAFSSKVLYIVLALACVLIGLLGLVVPVIPGVLFLGVALYLVTKVSRRVKYWTDASPLLKGMNSTLARMEHGSIKDRAKLVGLATLAVLTQTLGQVQRLGRWLTAKLQQRRQEP